MAYYTWYRLAEVTFDIMINSKKTNLGLEVNLLDVSVKKQVYWSVRITIILLWSRNSNCPIIKVVSLYFSKIILIPEYIKFIKE